jgi:hypothetical protein
MARSQFRSDPWVNCIRVSDEGSGDVTQAAPTTTSAPADLGQSEAAYASDSNEFDASW